MHKAECLEKSGEMPLVLKIQKIRELSYEQESRKKDNIEMTKEIYNYRTKL